MHQRETGPVEQQIGEIEEQVIAVAPEYVAQENEIAVAPDDQTVRTDNRGRTEVQENLRRSERVRKPPNRYGYDGTQGFGYIVEVLYAAKPGEENLVTKLLKRMELKPHRQQVEAYRTMMEINHELNTIEYKDPAAYVATNTDPDTLKWHQAIKEEDWENFYEAAQKEIQTLQDIGTWEEVERSKVPKGTNILPGTWVFKRKRYPDGKLRKHKARYCVRGDKQVAGVDYFETYAPVTSWSTVRLMFCLSIVCGLESVQVDYTNAFAQADIKEAVYITVPQGFTTSNPDRDIVLRLLKSLYGLVQAPRVFYEHLGENLRKIGFTPCVDVDPCLWVHKQKQMVVIIWVDDCLFFHKDKAEIHKVVDQLGKTMPLTKEENITAFLGIEIKQEGSKYFLTQPRLIERCIEAVNMVDANSAKTPAQTTPLGQDTEGAIFQESWEYASVVGMLMYLANNTRPDIAYATHQCARFTHKPRASHALAIKRIVRYLIGTKDKGLILEPSKDIMVDCYVDADFAGLYNIEDCQDPISAKSRTGYILMLSKCPLLWVSKLQTEIALSTMEAEYIALSQSMRDLIPIRRLVNAVCNALKCDMSNDPKMHSKVFEDNNGALQLGRAPRITPRTKHYNIKYHFFREQVKNGNIKLYKVDTKKQLADIFTKGLVQATFEELRKMMMGW